MNYFNSIWILIPAYKPQENLITIVETLATQFNIIIVDDGSGQEFGSIFSSVGSIPNVTFLQHSINRGKGQALKTGLDFLNITHLDCQGVITVDADGQHAPMDVEKLAIAMLKAPDDFFLGVRSFGKDTPLRSKFGNNITKILFRIITGYPLQDTQTGLRGIPKLLFPELISLKASRYDFELEMLLHLCNKRVALNQIPITTIYENNNASSHFNPLVDSARIYFVFIRFFAVSLLTALIDYLVFTLVWLIGGGLLTSITSSRLVAGIFNFSMNRGVVFKSTSNIIPQLIKYIALVVAFMFVSFLAIETLSSKFNINIIFAKLISEGILFIASFSVQRIFIFNTWAPKND